MTTGLLDVTDGLPHDWDRLAGDDAFTGSTWIGLGAHRLPGPLLGFRTATPGGLTDVAVPGSIAQGPGDPRIDPYQVLSGRSADVGLLANGPHPWRDTDPGEVFPMCVLAQPHYETTLAGPGAQNTAVVRDFLLQIGRWCAGNGVRSLAIPYVPTTETALVGAARELGMLTPVLAGRCDLTVTWEDFEGYLAGLSSRRRVRIRREVRALTQRGVEVTARPLRATEPELLALRCALVTKYGGRPDPAGEARRLAAVREAFGDDAVVFQVVLDDRVISASVFLRSGRRWVAHLTGTDHSHTAATLLYFATMFYAPVARAPKCGITEIRYGFGSWEAKRLRGCTATPVHVLAGLPPDAAPRGNHPAGGNPRE